MEKILRNSVDLQSMYNGKSFNGDAHYFEDITTPASVRTYLDSFQEADKLKGMKLLLAMLSKGKDIPEFFPDVVKNVVVKSIEVKKMVYIYLVHYADFDANCREIALLSINSFQKDMSGTNPLIRGLALRVMTSIRVHDIIQIQLLAVRKCATDGSPYVRKCAANAIPKIFTMDAEQLEHLKQILELLLKDSSTMVLGSTIAAFNEVCPTDYALLHQNFRKLCHLLADMDEWTQVSVLEVLTRYTRNQFTDPAPGVATAVKLQAKQRSSAAVQGRLTTTVRRRVVKKAFYSDEEDQSEEENVDITEPVRPDLGSVFTGPDADTEGDLDPDHRLVLKSSLPLLKSRNSGVVLAVCTLHYYCGTQSAVTTQQIAKALVRVLRNRREAQFVLLTCINTMARDRPAMFRPYLSDFFIKSTDPVFSRLLKLEILTSVSCADNTQAILRELQTYIKDGNEKFVCTAVRAVGQLADADPAVSGACMEGIMHLLLCTKTASITRECVVVLRQLLQQNSKPATGAGILRQLAKLLIIEGGMEEPSARSSVIWLVGEFHSLLADVSPDILRILAAGFVQECTEAKAQILNLAVKLSLQLPDDEKVHLLMTYVLEMARYDLDTDLRDRSRFLTAMMGLALSGDGEESDAAEATADEEALSELNEHAKCIMLASKLPPVTLLGSVDVEGIPNFTLGSLSSIVGHNAGGYAPLQAWPEVQPDPSIRDSLRNHPSEGSLYGGDTEPRRFASNAAPRRGYSSSSSSEDDGGLDTFYGGKPKPRGAKPAAAAAAVSSSSASGGSGSEESDSSSTGSEEDAESSGGSGSSSGDTSSDSESDSESSHGAHRGTTSRPAQPSPKPTAQSGGKVSFVPTEHKVPALSQGGSQPAAAEPAQTAKVMSGVRRVAATSKARRGGGSVETLVPTVVHGDVGGQGDLLDHADLRAHSPATHQGGELLLDHGEDSGLSSGLANLDIGLLQPEVRASPLPAPGDFAGLPDVAPSLPPQMMLASAMPLPSASNALALSSGYTGLSALVASAGLPSAMMGSPQKPGLPPASNISGGIAGGNQRMMMQPSQQQSAGVAMGASLGGVGSGQQVVLSSQPPAVDGEFRTPPKVILRPEMGGGLSIALVLRNGVPAVILREAFSALLMLKNVGDQLLRRVKVNLPTEIRRTAIPEIAVLAPGEEAWVPLELALGDLNGKPAKVDVRCDKGVYAGVLTASDWDLLQPLAMARGEFEYLRSRLGGLNEICRTDSTAALNLACCTTPSGVENELLARVRASLNVHIVQEPGRGELMLAGCVRKGAVAHRLLLTIVSQSPNEVSLRLNCEDPVLCNALGDALFKLFSR